MSVLTRLCAQLPAENATAAPWRRLNAVAALIFTLAFSLCGPAYATLSFPTLSGRVVDDAHVLSPEVKADLTAKLADLETRTSRQLVVVTLPSLQGDDIADYGYQLGRAWGVGQKGLNNGTLFIVAPSEHKVRIEVGYGMEPILTDALTSVILQEKVLPKFRAGDISGGVVDGTQAIINQMGADPSVAEQRAADAERQRQAQSLDSGHKPVSLLGLIVPLLFIVFVFGGLLRGGRGGGLLPMMLLGGILGSLRGGDDDEGGFGGGGGGFSGGGGSFGGGGSSGSW